MNLSEEKVTKNILNWLEANGWNIICFDFPQSGTGVVLHPNEEIRTTKNKGAIIPDIVAIKNNVVVFFENKDRFVFSDFLKIQELRELENHSNSIQRLLKEYRFSKIYYGVGLPYSSNLKKHLTGANLSKVDFVLTTNFEGAIAVNFDSSDIFRS